MIISASAIAQSSKQIVYPVTIGNKVSDNYFGTVVPDPYRWLENDTAQNVKDWVDYMIYYNIIKWITCLEELKDCDVVGVNLQKYPWHFSGNFWWSKSSHIKTLGVISDRSYNGPEFYITSKSGTYVSLFNSNVNHYHEGYPYELYHNKVKRMIICKSD